MKRVAALLALALLIAAACDRPKTSGPPRSPRFDEEEPLNVIATPAIAPGEWKLAVEGTGANCGLDPLPGTVFLTGRRGDWHAMGSPGLLDMAGAWNGTGLTLTGSASRSWRPNTDCVVAERESFSLRRAPGSKPGDPLAGDITFERQETTGAGCSDAVSVVLPCRVVSHATLAFASTRPAPEAGAFDPVAAAAPTAAPSFAPFHFDPEAEPTSAPDLIEKPRATPRPAAETPTPVAKPTPKKKKPR